MDHGSPQHPYVFNGNTYKLNDTTGKHWDTTISCKKETKIELEADWQNGLFGAEHLCVYKVGSKATHCVYVDRFDVQQKKLLCINSWGPQDEYPEIAIADVIDLYRVTCTAIEKKRNPSRSSSGQKQITGHPSTDTVATNSNLQHCHWEEMLSSNSNAGA